MKYHQYNRAIFVLFLTSILTMGAWAQSKAINTILSEVEVAESQKNFQLGLTIIDRELPIVEQESDRAELLLKYAELTVRNRVRVSRGKGVRGSYTDNDDRFDQAIGYCREVIGLPGSTLEQRIRAHEEIVSILEGRGRGDEALKQRQEILALDGLSGTKQAHHLFELGLKLRDRVEGQKLMIQALAFPNLDLKDKIRMMKSLAFSYHASGNYLREREIYSEVLGLQGLDSAEQFSALYNLTKLDLQEGKLQAAQERASKLLKFQSERHAFLPNLLTLGEEFRKAADNKTAETFLLIVYQSPKATESQKENSGVELAAIAQSQKKLPEAHRYYEALPLSHAAVSGNLALYHQEGRYLKVAETYSAAVQSLLTLWDSKHRDFSERAMFWSRIQGTGVTLARTYGAATKASATTSAEVKEAGLVILKALLLTYPADSNEASAVKNEIVKRGIQETYSK